GPRGNVYLGVAAMLAFTVGSNSGSGQYIVHVIETERGLRMTCSCEAAIHGDLCRHRLALLSGDLSALISGAEQAADLGSLVTGSAVLAEKERLDSLEKEAANVKRAIAGSKRALARLMEG
ncbi:MAG: SWIM zinc finger family protein, partial [Patescibacteria group bacterium]|nr:SWIM zinc finger family protein [Patescibacteria group bacterium]